MKVASAPKEETPKEEESVKEEKSMVEAKNEPEKNKEHLETNLDFFDKVKKKKKVDVVVKITNKEVS